MMEPLGLRLSSAPMPGISAPFSYLSVFGGGEWHMEDGALYSVNAHHGGEPKNWLV